MTGIAVKLAVSLIIYTRISGIILGCIVCDIRYIKEAVVIYAVICTVTHISVALDVHTECDFIARLNIAVGERSVCLICLKSEIYEAVICSFKICI